ncbi:hypothetical protein [Streptomyces sp. NPDC059928]|uniref:hypothetical protein n=1 Tax=unclassified Streptomyces TaxID=2593676 RepID=UPI0036572882
MTTSVDLAEQIHHLRNLAHDFKALHREVLDLDVAPGSDALRQLTPLVLKSQTLVGKALLPLCALDASPYAAVAGSRESFDALTALVSGASLAGCDLAHALAANPLDSIGFDGPSRNEDSIRTTRHTQALPKMARHLADAARQFEVCEAACHYLAGGIAEDLERASASTQRAPHRLSLAQNEALRALAKGGATMRKQGGGSRIVVTSDRTRITISTFQSLDKRGLVHVDTSVPLSRGRGITVTPEGHRALAHHQARTGVSAGPAAARPATTAGRGARR